MMQENSEWGFRVAVFSFKYKPAFQKTQKTDIKKTKNRGRLGFIKKRGFLNPDYLSILFCDFPLIARSGTSHVAISLIG